MMTNNEKLANCFSEGLGIQIDLVVDDLAYRSIPQWDSVAHMALITEIETVFDVMLDTDEIIDMSSVAVARQILGKHGVAF